MEIDFGIAIIEIGITENYTIIQAVILIVYHITLATNFRFISLIGKKFKVSLQLFDIFERNRVFIFS